MLYFLTGAQTSVEPELAFADGYPVALDDVILNEDVTFECKVYNNVDDLPVTHYRWDVATVYTDSDWSCADTTTSSTMTCTVSNDCSMFVECTPFSYDTGGRMGSVVFTVQGDLAIYMPKLS